MKKPLYIGGEKIAMHQQKRSERYRYVSENLLTDALFLRIQQYLEAQRGLMPFERKRAARQIAKDFGFEDIAELEWFTVTHPKAPDEWGGF